MNFIGKPLTRVDALDKIEGKPVYAGDFEFKGMLFGGILRSKEFHAEIVSIDTSKVKGVKIFTSKDIPGENLYGVITKDQPFLAEKKVRFYGEPIALVVGETYDDVYEAINSIKVDYKPLPVIKSPEEAMKEDAVKIHENGNILAFKKVVKGNINEVKKSSHLVIENLYETSFLEHMFLETESGVGYYDEKEDKIVIISSTQNIHYKRKEISRMLNLPEDKIIIIQAVTGGGFGGKLDVTVEGWIALAVYHTKKPVKITLTRDDSFLTNTKRHALKFYYTSYVDKSGYLKGVKVKIVGDTGAYASYGATVCLRAAVHCTGPYNVPNVYAESVMCYTNNHPCGAMRGFGIPQIAFAHESQMDEIAEKLNIDPFELRMKNVLKKGDLTATGQKLNYSVGIGKTLERLKPVYGELRKKGKKGVGIGCMYYGIGNTGIPNPSTIIVELSSNGKIVVHSGVCEIGQGSDTILYQIALETLKISPDLIEFTQKDTSITEDAGSTSASRQTYISGKALYEACVQMREFLEKENFYSGKRSLKDIFREKGNVKFTGYFDPPTSKLDPETSQGVPYATYAFATHIAVVEVDEITGFTDVKEVYACHDVGKAINPVLLKGQVNSGVAMGVGMALMEKFVPKETENLHKYYIPTSMDMPEVKAFFVEDEEPTGPYGAKGIGEPALIPTAPAIINAIKDFTGVRVYKLPADIETLKMSLESGVRSRE